MKVEKYTSFKVLKRGKGWVQVVFRLRAGKRLVTRKGWIYAALLWP